MTKKEISDKIKWIDKWYLLKFNPYRMSQLRELIDTLSIRHPQYDQLEGFIQFINDRVQANEDFKNNMQLLLSSKAPYENMYEAVEATYNIYLKPSFVRGAEDFLDTISWRHPQYDALEESIKFAYEQEEQWTDLLNYVDAELGGYI